MGQILTALGAELTTSFIMQRANTFTLPNKPKLTRIFDREEALEVQGITLMMVRELSFSKNLYFVMK